MESSKVCNSGQYIYVMGLCNFFFVPQDLTDKINSYFQIIGFLEELASSWLLTITSQIFSDENKQPSLKWRCVYVLENLTESRR